MLDHRLVKQQHDITISIPGTFPLRYERVFDTKLFNTIRISIYLIPFRAYFVNPFIDHHSHEFLT